MCPLLQRARLWRHHHEQEEKEEMRLCVVVGMWGCVCEFVWGMACNHPRTEQFEVVSDSRTSKPAVLTQSSTQPTHPIHAPHTQANAVGTFSCSPTTP